MDQPLDVAHTNQRAKSTVSELIAHWNIQENLFQGYRRTFLTLQILMLSIAALSLSKNVCLPVGIAIFIATFFMAASSFFILIPMIKERGEMVFYWQAKILKAERGETIYIPLMEMKEFVGNPTHPFRSDPDYRFICNDSHKQSRKGDPFIRKNLNTYPPFIITISWIFMLIIFVINSCAG